MQFDAATATSSMSVSQRGVKSLPWTSAQALFKSIASTLLGDASSSIDPEVDTEGTGGSDEIDREVARACLQGHRVLEAPASRTRLRLLTLASWSAQRGVATGDDAKTRSSISFDQRGVSKVRIQLGKATDRRRTQKRKMAHKRASGERLEKERLGWEHIEVYTGALIQRRINLKPKFAEVDPYINAFLEEQPTALPAWCHPEEYTMFLPCDKAQMDHLKKFDRPIRTLPEPLKPIWEAAVKLTTLACEPDVRAEFPDVSDLVDVPYDRSKFAGYEYAAMGMRTRGEANQKALADAEEAFMELMEGELVTPHAVRMGGRGKLAKMTREQAAEGDMAKGRLILMLSSRDLKILGATEKILTTMAKAPEIPIFVGKSFFFGGATWLNNKLRRFTKFYLFDAKKFDSSIDPYMVDMAIHMFRGWFYEGHDSRFDAYWSFVRESLLDSLIIRDDGFVYLKHVGTTSGHSHNTLFQSSITITLGYCLLIIRNPDKTLREIFEHSYVAGLGDDNLIAIDDTLEHFTCDEGGVIIRECFGIDWTGEKSFATSGFCEGPNAGDGSSMGGGFEGVQFLGKYFKEMLVSDGVEEVPVVVPHRPADETILKCMYPERQPSKRALEMFTEAELVYQRLAGHYIDNAGNEVARAFLDQALDFLERKGVQSSTGMNYKMKMKFFGGEHEDASREIRLRRFNFEEWLDLVACDKKMALDRQGEAKCQESVQTETWDDTFPEL